MSEKEKRKSISELWAEYLDIRREDRREEFPIGYGVYERDEENDPEEDFWNA